MKTKESAQNPWASWADTKVDWDEVKKEEEEILNRMAKLDNYSTKEPASKVQNSSSIEIDKIPIHKDGGMNPTSAVPHPSDTEEITAPANKYVFLISELEPYKDCESEGILINLDKISQISKRLDKYLVIRNVFLDLSIELNSRGLIAPAFRPFPTIPRRIKKFSETHRAIQRDRVVIDCHWLHSRNERVSISENKWRGLLDTRRDFQYEKVAEFASTSITNEYRADGTLRLTPRQQCQLVAIRGNRTREQFDKLVTNEREKGKPRTPPRLELIELAINHWCERDCRVEKYRLQYFAIAKAVELLGNGATAKHIAELTGLILGEKPLSERSILAKRNKLKIWVPT